MGEYVKIKGQQVKLGTCENLYYTRFNQLKEAVSTMEFCEGNDQPTEYLKESNGFRYRFPFPEEDNLGIGEYKDHEKGLLFLADETFSFDVSHSKKCVSTCVQGGAYNINHYIACPNSKEWVQTCSARNGFPYLLKQQKQVNGQLWIVCECGYCGQAFRLDEDGARQICRFFVKELNFRKNSPYYSESRNKYYMEVIRRIMAGYKTN